MYTKREYSKSFFTKSVRLHCSPTSIVRFCTAICGIGAAGGASVTISVGISVAGRVVCTYGSVSPVLTAVT